MARSSDTQGSTAIDEVTQYLSDRVNAGEFTCGDRLPSRSVLARRFHVSPGTISIALRRLNAIHPLDFAPGVGVFLAREDAAKDVLRIGLIGRYASSAADNVNSAGRRRDSYWEPILQSIVNGCARQGHVVVVIPESAQEPLDLDRILSHGARCLISHGIDLHRSAVLEIKRRGVPLILGRRPSDSVLSVGVSYVDYDWAGGLRQAMDIFARRGHTRIACVAVPQVEGGCERWREVFFAAAARLGLSSTQGQYCRVLPKSAVEKLSITSGAFMCDELLDLQALPEPPTAVFCSAFEETIRPALDALAGQGITVGQGLSLACLAPEWPRVPLTVSAFVQTSGELGGKLVETAAKLADDPAQVFHVDVPFQFIDRGSITAIDAGKEVNAQV